MEKEEQSVKSSGCGSEIEKQGCFIPFPFWRVIRSSIVNKAAQFSAHSRCYSMLDRLSNESKRRTTRRGLQLVVGGRTRWTNSLESRFRVKMKIAQKTPVPFFLKAAWQARKEREKERTKEREIEREKSRGKKDGKMEYYGSERRGKKGNDEKERKWERERRGEKQREWGGEHANLLNYIKIILLPYDYYVRYTLCVLYLCLNNRC